MKNIIPTPKENALTDNRREFNGTYAVMPAFANAGRTLADFALRLHGIVLQETHPASAASIVFATDSTLGDEGYSIAVTDSRVTVRAATELGAQNAVSTLEQLMEKCGDGFSLPLGELRDAPESSWRGVMVDLARDWHEPHYLREYVDMCRFFKVRYLHLHFTDDQSYTLPSLAFPKLSTDGRSYSRETLQDLVAYARLRGVQIIPEIDVPGHTTSFKTYGDIFGTDGIICQNPQSMAAMATLFTELCDLFEDSEYIHIGGDEADIAKWTECPRCREAFKLQGVDVDGMEKGALSQLMYATFIRRMAEAVTACGRTPVVWEGFAESVNHLIPRNTVVISWENYYQLTPSLLKAGFRIINCTWSPLYIVTPNTHWSPETIYNWNVHTWHPIHPNSPYKDRDLTVEPTEQIEGAQLAAWGDRIMGSFANVDDGVREEQRLIEERLPVLAENTWNRVKRSEWTEFSARLEAVGRLYGRLK